MKSKARCFEIAEKKFKEIQKKFPELTMYLDYDVEELDLSMDIPIQNGVDFEINLNLQNEDELHIVTDYFWHQFFSADSDEITNTFYESVIGLLEGNYRVLQLVNNNKVYRTILQKPSGDDWKTIYTGYERIKLPWIKLKENIIQNKKESKLIKLY